MPTDRDMHDFQNRTPGTLYSEYRTWVADGGAKSPKVKPIGGVIEGGGRETTGAALWALAVSMVAAFCLLGWIAAVLGCFFAVGAFAFRWAPVVYIGKRRPGMVARWASYVSWSVLAAMLCLLAYRNMQ